MDFDQLPEDERWIEVNLEQAEDGTLQGEFKTPRTVSQLTDFQFEKDSDAFSFKGSNETTGDVEFECVYDSKESTISGQIDMGRFQVEFTLKKSDNSVSRSRSQSSFQLIGHRTKTSAPVEDPVTGVWTASMESEEIPNGSMEFTIEMKMDDDGNVTGILSSPMGEMEIFDGTFNTDTKKLRMEVSSEESGMSANVVATLKGGTLNGTVIGAQGAFEVDFTAERTSTELPTDEPKGQADDDQEETKQEPKPVEGEKGKQQKRVATSGRID